MMPHSMAYDRGYCQWFDKCLHNVFIRIFHFKTSLRSSFNSTPYQKKADTSLSRLLSRLVDVFRLGSREPRQSGETDKYANIGLI